MAENSVGEYQDFYEEKTYLGMDKALTIIYYMFYGTDIATDETAGSSDS